MAVCDIDINKDGLCYLGNSKLKRAHVKIPYTQEQVDEFIRCQQDPIYFIRNYINIVSLDHGMIKFDMYDYQETMIKTFRDNRFVINLLARQMGKCLGKDMNIRIRNKKTGDVYEIAIGKFFEDMQETQLRKSSDSTKVHL